MNMYIALFRGINVGGKNILPMQDLVGHLQYLGFDNIATYIQSGNVVFQSKQKDKYKIIDGIQSKIVQHHSFKPEIILLHKNELERAATLNPFNSSEGKTLHFYFMNRVPEKPDLEKLTLLKTDSEEYQLLENIFYLYAPEGIGRSKLAAHIEKCMGVPTTARNLNTVKRLLQMSNS